MAQKHKYVSIEDVIKTLQVSESTVRRDIDELETKNLVFRSQGMIVWNDKNNQYLENIFYRRIQNLDVKKRVSACAAKLIEPNETIYIDTGSTMMELVKNISDDTPLLVATNDLEIALALENKFNVTTIMLGGIVKRGTHTVIDNMSSEILDNLNFQKAFFSPGGIIESGFTFLNIQAMEIRRKAAIHSESMIMVSDSRKLGKRSSVLGFTFKECDTLFIDTCPDDWRRRIEPHTNLVIVDD